MGCNYLRLQGKTNQKNKNEVAIKARPFDIWPIYLKFTQNSKHGKMHCIG